MATINHPKSEKTITSHKFEYKGVKYVNDIGSPCLYRAIKNDVDTLERVQYYGGRLLHVMSVKKQPL